MISKETFWKFSVVGALGFVVDAGILSVWIAAGGGPVIGRLVSSSIAILCTYLFNRFWAFQSAAGQGPIAAFFRYLAVQATGWLTNFGTYLLVLNYTFAPLNAPVAAVMVGSAVALLVNYLGASTLVFRK